MTLKYKLMGKRRDNHARDGIEAITGLIFVRQKKKIKIK